MRTFTFENFLLTSYGDVPSHSQAQELLPAVGAKVRTKLGAFLTRPADIYIQTGSGTVEIEYEFCTHALEMAFPPFGDMRSFRLLFQETVAVIYGALRDESPADQEVARLIRISEKLGNTARVQTDNFQAEIRHWVFLGDFGKADGLFRTPAHFGLASCRA